MPWVRKQRCALSLLKQYAVAGVLYVAVVWHVEGGNVSPSQLKFRQRVWTREDGLPSNEIRAIQQTKDGFLWVATPNGLARFDGINFRLFNRSNTPVFQGDECTALAEDRMGNLWVGTSKGLIRTQNGDWKLFTTEDLLWDNQITALCATSSGDLWIGTMQGPVRFLNGGFTRFDPRGVGRKQGDRITNTLYEDRDGSVWIGSQTGSQRWDSKLERLTDEFFFDATLYMRQFAEDFHGNFWMKGYYLWNKKDSLWNISVETTPFSDANISAIFTDRRGSMWMATISDGLIRWDDGRISARPEGVQLPDPEVSCMFDDNEGNIWIGTKSGGLVQLRPHRFQQYTARDGLLDDYVWSICERRDGSIWVGTRKGISVLPSTDRQRDGDASTAIESSRESADGTVPSVPADAFTESVKSGKGTTPKPSDLRENGDLAFQELASIKWVGTEEGTVRVLYEDKGGVLWIGINGVEHVVRCIVEDRTGRIWTGTDRGLYCWHNNRWMLYTKADGIPENDIRAIVEDKAGGFWIGTLGGGLCRWNPPNDSELLENIPANPESPSPSEPGLSDTMLRIINREIREGVSSFRELGRSRGDETHSFEAKQSLLTSSPIREEALPEPGASEFKKLTLTTAEGLCDDTISALYMDAEGVLWVGTPEGLNRIFTGDVTHTKLEAPSPRFATPVQSETTGSLPVPEVVSFTTQNGLFNNTISQILEDDFGQLWLGSGQGIFRVSKQELNAVAEGRASSVHCVGYDESDGLYSSEVNSERSQSGATKTADGLLWFPTTKGIVVIDPRNTCPTEVPPAVYIEQIRLNGRVVFDGAATETNQLLDGSSNLEMRGSAIQFLPGSGGSVEIRYTAPTFTVPRNCQFRFRLEGSDSEWREAGNERVAYYTNLQPGNYHFHVIAGNHHGVWNTAGASFAFYITQHFYETSVFYGSCGAVVLAAAFGFYRWRATEHEKLHRLKAEASLAKERARIARDIHDDLGSGLTQIGLLTELANRTLDKGASAGPYVRKIASAVGDISQSVDEIVWAVNPGNDSLKSVTVHGPECEMRASKRLMKNLRGTMTERAGHPPRLQRHSRDS